MLNRFGVRRSTSSRHHATTQPFETRFSFLACQCVAAHDLLPLVLTTVLATFVGQPEVFGSLGTKQLK